MPPLGWFKQNDHWIEGDTVHIALSKGKEALVDVADLPKVLQRRWYTFESKPGRFYAISNRTVEGKRETIYMARWIMDAPPGREVDHIRPDDTLDNRRSNLRIVTQAENRQNLRGAYKNSKTGVRGITIRYGSSGNKRYFAAVTVNGQQHNRYFPYTHEGLVLATRFVEELRARLMPNSAEYKTIKHEVVAALIHGRMGAWYKSSAFERVKRATVAA